MMNISICILTYNRKKILEELILSLLNLKSKCIEIIVVDNHSDDGTEKLMIENGYNVIYIRTHKNIGVGARNIAFKKAKGDIIITLDDDILNLTDDDIANITQKFSNFPKLGAINFKVVGHETGEICNWIHHREVEKYQNLEFLTYEISEGAVAFRKSVLEKVGFYPEYFFISHEGPDLACRILDYGYNIIYFPTVSVIHCHSESDRKKWFRYYYDTRNQFWLAIRNFHISYAIKYLLIGLFSTFLYSLRDGFVIYWLRGLLDGILGIKHVIKDRKKLSKRTMHLIKKIDQSRPSFFYMVKKRIFNKEMRL